MQYVYVLHSKIDDQLYVGCIYDLEKRLQEHNAGQVPATRERRPLEVIHYEAFKNKYDAYFREKWLKTGWGRRYLRKTLHNTIKNLGGPRPPKFLSNSYVASASKSKKQSQTIAGNRGEP